MSAWTWLLIALSAAGVLLAVSSLAIVAVGALALRAKMQAMARRPLFLSLEGLQLQALRLAQLPDRTQPLTARAQTALVSIRESLEAFSMPRARRSLEPAVRDVKALSQDLR